MATYEFSCDRDGITAQRLPLGQAPTVVPCPTCGGPAKRRFSAPQLRLGDSRARRLIASTEASAAKPTVVSAPAGRRTRPGIARTFDPRQLRLPRP
ncbi:MAG: zinc ribbon domain-containing protein [Nostocoides sp.]